VKTTMAEVAKAMTADPVEVELVEEQATDFAELDLELAEMMMADLSQALDTTRCCRWNCRSNQSPLIHQHRHGHIAAVDHTIENCKGHHRPLTLRFHSVFGSSHPFHCDRQFSICLTHLFLE
jgi:hypothetical protein